MCYMKKAETRRMTSLTEILKKSSPDKHARSLVFRKDTVHFEFKTISKSNEFLNHKSQKELREGSLRVLSEF